MPNWYKKAQTVNNLSGEDDFSMPQKPSKEYFASIGVRIRVVPQSDPNAERQLAQQAFEAIKEQIQSGVEEDSFEAWLSGQDDTPKTYNEIISGP